MHLPSRRRLSWLVPALVVMGCAEESSDLTGGGSNSSPEASIASPADGTISTPGDGIRFEGSGSDLEDGAVTGERLTWVSSLDDEIGTGASFLRNDLSIGAHTITLRAVDSEGGQGIATIAITVAALATSPPVASIVVPTSGSTFSEGTPVTFQGTGEDLQDGSLSGSGLAWTSSLDGQIGTGSSFAHSALAVGAHTITLTATDSDGVSGSATISVTVTSSTPPPSGALIGVPLIDMGASDRYKGFAGRLYPSGNSPPSAHRGEGVRRANAVTGTAVLMSLGMSNTEQHFASFLTSVAADATLSPDLVVVNGAQSGMAASSWESPSRSTYNVARSRLGATGVSEADVDALWILLANKNPTVAMPSGNSNAVELQKRLGNVLRAAKTRYPNLRQVFFSSRIYSCARTGLSPEPYAYESGYAVKWLIEAQINQIATGQVDPVAGDLDYRTGVVPWVAWSSYLWADNGNTRSDGLRWLPSDLAADCVHPSASGTAKASAMLMSFFKGSSLTRPWFLP